MSFLESLQHTTGRSGLMFGLVTAKVIAIGDGNNAGKVKVQYEVANQTLNATDFIPVMTPYATGDMGPTSPYGGYYGFHMMPEFNSRVVVAFLNGDRNNPIVIGSLYSFNQRKVPNGVSFADNHVKALVTKSGSSISFDDTNGSSVVKLSTGQGSYISVGDADPAGGKMNLIMISDKAGTNCISMNLQSGKVDIKANTTMTLAVGANQIMINSAGVTIGAGDSSIMVTAAGVTIAGPSIMLN